jgi:hypothetical protein
LLPMALRAELDQNAGQVFRGKLLGDANVSPITQDVNGNDRDTDSAPSAGARSHGRAGVERSRRGIVCQELLASREVDSGALMTARNARGK